MKQFCYVGACAIYCVKVTGQRESHQYNHMAHYTISLCYSPIQIQFKTKEKCLMLFFFLKNRGKSKNKMFSKQDSYIDADSGA